jgi:hypothetical protein
MSDVTEATPAPAPVEAEQAAPQTPETTAPAADTQRAELIKARQAALQQRLEATRKAAESAKKYQASESALQARMKELEAREAKIQAEAEKWANAYNDPIKAFSNLGLKPEQVFNRLHDYFVDADAPEAKQRRQMEEMKRELTSAIKNPDFDSVKAELEQVKAQLQTQQQREKQKEYQAFAAEKSRREAVMVNTFKDAAYEELTDYYDDDSLLRAAYHVTEMQEKAGESTDFEVVAKKMLALHQDWIQNVEGKKKARQVPAPQAAKPPFGSKPSEKESKRASTANIGNAVAAEVASGRDKTKEQRAAERRQAIDSMLGKFRDK